MTKNMNYAKVLPVLFGFFVMGFCDVVGITTAHVKEDFLGAYSPAFRDTLSNMIPVALFSMFLIFSIPTGILMNKIGRKKTVLLSSAITLIAMFIPLIEYSFAVVLLAFALLGIANTILQVSLNPLISNVVQGEQLNSSLTAGQFVKAVSSLCAPLIAAFSASQLGDWQYIFPIYAVITVLSTLWLLLTPIMEISAQKSTASFFKVMGLLKDKTLLILFLAMIGLVGVDVGINIASPKILMERCDLSSIEAGYGPSFYFVFRMLGAFAGTFLLARVANDKFFKINMLIEICALIALVFVNEKWTILIACAIVGFTISNIFPIVFGKAIRTYSDKSNEISGLMITGVTGGAIIPFLMGLLSDLLGSQAGSVIIVLACTVYLYLASYMVNLSDN